MKLKDLLLATGLSLSPLINNYAQEVANVDKPIEKTIETEREIIKPSLEEITEYLKKDHNEILQSAINEGILKKFDYRRQTSPEDFYRFLNSNFQNKIVFVYMEPDEETDKKNIWDEKSTFDERLSAGSATVFLYTMLNLRKSNSNVGFLFLELSDFYGEENWRRLRMMVNNKLRGGFPSYIEFIKEKDGYRFGGLTGSSQRDPETILEWIEDYVEDYRKRTSK